MKQRVREREKKRKDARPASAGPTGCIVYELRTRFDPKARSFDAGQDLVNASVCR